ncbi:hypothetical protein [Streptomyces zaomyceticus]
MHIDLASDLRHAGSLPAVFFDRFCIDLFLVTHRVECVAILEPVKKDA